MKGNDFSNQEWLISTIADYLSKGGIKYTTENPDPEKLNFQFKFEDPALKLKIIVGQAKDNLYRIDIVSVINFSPEHINALNQASPKDKMNLLDDIFFWLSPRDPDFLINLNPKVESQPPHYLVILSIFEGDLTLGNLMRSIRLVVKSSGIARRRIQIHLAKYIKPRTLEQGNKEDGK